MNNVILLLLVSWETLLLSENLSLLKTHQVSFKKRFLNISPRQLNLFLSFKASCFFLKEIKSRVWSVARPSPFFLSCSLHYTSPREDHYSLDLFCLVLSPCVYFVWICYFIYYFDYIMQCVLVFNMTTLAYHVMSVEPFM